MAALQFRPARREDVSGMVEIYFSAFDGTNIQQRLFPVSSAESQPFWQKSMKESFSDPNTHIYVMEDTATGQLAAFAIWGAPRPADSPYSEPPPMEAFPQDGDPAAGAAFLRGLKEHHERLMSDGSGHLRLHWYLELIATRREYQGRGAAGQLLRWGEAQADAAGVECYLDATPWGRPVYEAPQHGFRLVESERYLEDAYEHYFMIRDAREGTAPK